MNEENRAAEQAKCEASGNIESTMMYEGKKLSLRVDNIEDGKGRHYKREIVIHPGAVVMIPVDEAGNIILVRQWRRAAGKILVELPAGTVEKDEPPIVTAGRELQEEIGYRAERITDLGGFYSAPGFSTEYLYLYLAEDLHENPLPPDIGEEIEVFRVSLKEAIAMIEHGEIEDAKSIAGISRYYFGQYHP